MKRKLNIKDDGGVEMNNMKNFDKTKEKFIEWWKGNLTGGPLMHIIAKKENGPEYIEGYDSYEEKFTNINKIVKNYESFMEAHDFLAEAYPNLIIDLGPGSLAGYVGSKPVFGETTVWYEECIPDWNEWKGFVYDDTNPWWVKHREMAKRAVELSKGRFLVNIPDIIENIDIIAAMRGATNVCYDLLDSPEIIKKSIGQIDNIYFEYYNQFYDIVKDKDGGCSYTMFRIWGPGKTGKIQCDFSALMSPAQYKEFIIPSLRKQCEILDYSLYHLDGPDAIRHLEAVMELEELDALQWTPGAGNADGLNEKWFPIYDKAAAAGKQIWIKISDEGQPTENEMEKLSRWEREIEEILKRYGSRRIYLMFKEPMTQKQAKRLLELRETKWSKY